MKKNISKNLSKIILTTIAIFMVISSVLPATINYTLATEIDGVNIDTNKSVNTGGLTTTANKVLGVIKVVGVIAAVGILMVIGIKYMMGSAEEKAEYKKVFMPYIIGAVLLFAASMLAETVYNLASGITG